MYAALTREHRCKRLANRIRLREQKGSEYSSFKYLFAAIQDNCRTPGPPRIVGGALDLFPTFSVLMSASFGPKEPLMH